MAKPFEPGAMHHPQQFIFKAITKKIQLCGEG